MLLMLGASYPDVAVTQLEEIAAGSDSIRTALRNEISQPDSALAGAVLLATCNRLEVYLDASKFHEAVDVVARVVAQATGMSATQAETVLRVRVGDAVATHLFSVASGLEAMVVGEAEIAGQVSSAQVVAQRDATMTPTLHSLFRRAARTSKAVASQTKIGAEGRSIATVALGIAAEHLELASARVLIIGTGAYARVLAAALAARGCDRLQVYSASGRAATFAASHNAQVVTTAELPQVLQTVDLVVTASGRGASLPISAELRSALAARAQPLVAIDLALIRDIPDEIRTLPTVAVIDLQTVAEAAGPAHGSELRAAQQLVLAGVKELRSELAERALDPAVVALRSHVYAVVDAELIKLRRKYDPEVVADLERALNRVTKSLLHTPTMRAKELARDGSSADYLKALHTLFDLNPVV